MYDTIICKYPLPMPSDPKGYAGSEDFQTKHLDCGLDTYEIAANGQLSVYKREGNYIEPDKEAKGLFEKIGRFEVTRTWLEPVYDTLTMEMYDYRESSESGYDYFVQYQVIFIDGIVDEIKLTTFEATDNSARKIKDEEFKKKMKAWYDFKAPGEMHKWMEKTNGSWEADISAWMDPSAPPEKSKGTIVQNSILDNIAS